MHGGQCAMLGGGRPTLKTPQKSAEGIVDRGLSAEGPNAASAGRVLDERGEGSRTG